MFQNNKNYYEPFEATPFYIHLNELIYSMSDKLKIYKGTRKILVPKQCQFCSNHVSTFFNHVNRNLLISHVAKWPFSYCIIFSNEWSY